MTLDNAQLSSESKLGDLLDLIIDYRGKTPKKLGGDFTDSGIPVISAIHIKRGKIIWEERERFVSKEMFKKWMKEPLQKDDLLLTSEAPLGEVALVPSNAELVLSQRLFALRTKPEALDPRYLMYFFQSRIGQEELNARASGSTVVGIKQAELVNICIPCPPIKTQRIVGEVLSTLDLKISANEALSKTFEDIAQTIFKSWFIDFDPVKAKMNGEKPIGMDDVTAALFPDSFEESELGLIPQGWEVKSIGNLCETLLGGTPSRTKDDYWNGDIPWINSGKINDFRVLTASEYITKRGLDKSATKLLPSGTTVIAITGATLGQFSRLEIEACANQSVIGIIDSPLASNEFIYMQIKNGIHRLISAQTGGAQQHINKEDVNNFNIIYPNQALVSKFTSEVSAIFLQIGVLLKQSMTIVSIRDSLLPRLISGELEIPEEMLAS
jgi:type I restriction enzyme S subunit